jgi:hypothetical protein
VLARFAYLAVTHAFAALWLVPLTDREKDVKIPALRHKLTVLRRQLGNQRPQLHPEDRALLAALLKPLTRATLRRLRLLGQPRHRAALASQPGQTPPRSNEREPKTRASAHPHLDPPPRATPGSREPLLGLPTHPRRTRPAADHGGTVRSLGDSPSRGNRPRTAPRHHYLGPVPTLPGPGDPGHGLHRDHHPVRTTPIHPRRDPPRQPTDQTRSECWAPPPTPRTRGSSRRSATCL